MRHDLCEWRASEGSFHAQFFQASLCGPASLLGLVLMALLFLAGCDRVVGPQAKPPVPRPTQKSTGVSGPATSTKRTTEAVAVVPPEEDTDDPPPASTQEPPPPEKVASTEKAPAERTPDPSFDAWDELLLKGSKAGYSHTTIEPFVHEGQQRLRLTQEMLLRVTRGADASEQKVVISSVETLSGQLLSIETLQEFGPQPTIFRGRVDGQVLHMETVTAGKTSTEQRPWVDDIRGFMAVERSLMDQLPQPGEKRSLRMFVPVVNEIGQAEIIARDWEEITFQGQPRRMLRVDCVVKIGQQALPQSSYWLDEQAGLLRSLSPGLEMEALRTTKEQALANSSPIRFDLNTNTSVKLNRALANPHGTQRVQYRVTLTDGDPLAVFASGGSQKVASTGPHTAEITVVGLRPGVPSLAAGVDEPSETDRAANNFIQCDNADVRKMAAEAAPANVDDPWLLAQTLEHYIHHAIKLKNFSTAFATAAEVAKSREGDCTEHSVLLAALCRARGLPARVAMGLVYVEGRQAFFYHMWNEVWINDRWVPIDGTLGEGGIGGGHLKLAHSDLHGASAYSSFLPVAAVLGRLKIELIDYE